MEFGLGIPTVGTLATPESIAAIARHAEELGFGLACVDDHIVIPTDIATRYPYNEAGEYLNRDGSCMELLTMLAFLAGQTSRMRLVTSILVLPYRNLVHTAKVLATVDVLSQGRLIVGCGVGWMKEEFQALGAPPYEKRGEVSDEYIRAFKELWTSETPTFNGSYGGFSDIVFAPKPVQEPHPPIWIGGESSRALRRAARLGDGWYPTGVNRNLPLKTAPQLSRSIDQLRQYAEEAGRDPTEIKVAFYAGLCDDQEARMIDGVRRVFTGTPDQVADDIREFEEIGVYCVMFDLHGKDLATSLERMERFASRVMPLARP